MHCLKTPLLPCGLVMTVLTLAAPAAAQAISWRPSIAAAEVYDDNVFFAPSAPESDFIFRVTPAVDATYGSPRLTLTGRYSLDAERYQAHPNLDEAVARQQGTLTLHYVPTPALTFSTDAAYLTTTTPQEFNLETGLAVGRGRARRFEGRPTLRVRFYCRTDGTFEFGFVRDEIEPTALAPALGAESIDASTAAFTLRRALRATDAATVEYRLNAYQFGGPAGIGDTSGTLTSHVVLLGWAHAFSPITSMTLRAGPRASPGGLRPELSIDLRRRLERGSLSLTYVRTEDAAIGVAGTVEVSRAGLRFDAHPTRRIEVSAGPGLAKDVASSVGLDVTVFTADAAVTVPVGAWLSLRVAYEGAFENGAVQPATEQIQHSAFSLQFIVAPSGRTVSGGM